MTYWQGKVVLVTGASGGFGKILAGEFARQGAKVVITARDQSRLAQAVHELGPDAVSFPADVTQDDQVATLFERALDRFGQLDVLVNNLGRSMRGLAADTSPEIFQEFFEMNFLTGVRCVRAALPHLRATKGHIVFMGSLASKAATRYLGAYPATKFAVAAYAQQLRLELRSDGIHVLLVCPGPIHRDQEGGRYGDQARNLPDEARQPGAGVRIKRISPGSLAARIVKACEQRVPELVIPAKARLLFAISQLSPTLGDWILRRSSG